MNKYMWTIKYCGSWNYRPQAESLSVDMNNAGLTTTYEEGDTGQFELFKDNASYMKEDVRDGIPKFFTLEDVEKRLGGLGEY